MEFGCVSVREIGTWTLSMNSSQFSPDKQTLNPPQTSVVYSTEYDNKFEFKELLVESGCETHMADSLEKWLVHDKRECDIHENPFPLFGLGEIKDGNFIPEDDLIFDKFAGWNKVASPYIAQKKENVSHQDDYLFRLNNPYQEKKDNNRYSRYYGPLLIGLFLIMFILFWFFKPSSENSQMSQPASAPVTENLQEASPDSLIAEDSVIADEGTIRDLEVVPAENSSDDEKTKITEDTEAYTECVLIVGSFKYNRNSERMIETLRKDGYQTYTEIHNGFKRVGLIYDCHDIHPDSYKDEMRREVFPGAWNLHDTL
jgi:cell division septation protein DedD